MPLIILRLFFCIVFLSYKVLSDGFHLVAADQVNLLNVEQIQIKKDELHFLNLQRIDRQKSEISTFIKDRLQRSRTSNLDEILQKRGQYSTELVPLVHRVSSNARIIVHHMRAYNRQSQEPLKIPDKIIAALDQTGKYFGLIADSNFVHNTSSLEEAFINSAKESEKFFETYAFNRIGLDLNIRQFEIYFKRVADSESELLKGFRSLDASLTTFTVQPLTRIRLFWKGGRPFVKDLFDSSLKEMTRVVGRVYLAEQYSNMTLHAMELEGRGLRSKTDSYSMQASLYINYKKAEELEEPEHIVHEKKLELLRSIKHFEERNLFDEEFYDLLSVLKGRVRNINNKIFQREKMSLTTAVKNLKFSLQLFSRSSNKTLVLNLRYYRRNKIKELKKLRKEASLDLSAKDLYWLKELEKQLKQLRVKIS